MGMRPNNRMHLTSYRGFARFRRHVMRGVRPPQS